MEAHLGFSVYMARRYTKRGVADEDLRQVATLALVKAVDRFDPDRGFAFATFAGRTVEGEIKRHFRDKTWVVRVPRGTKELHLAVRRATDELSLRLGRSPTVPEVADHIGVATDDVVAALSAAAALAPESLDAPPRNDAGAAAGDRQAVLADDEDRFEAAEDRLAVKDLMATLPEREREIVRLRFYEDLTQTEIAERMGMSQMHVSRLLRRSFSEMREAVGAGGAT